jgi:hypothetical protein
MAAVQTSEVKITLALFNAQTLNAVCWNMQLVLRQICRKTGCNSMAI